MEENKTKILNLIRDFLEKTGIEADIETIEQADGILFNIKTINADFPPDDGKDFIISLNHIIKKIVQSLYKNEIPLRFFLDVNAHQKQRDDTLKELAKLSAQKVRYFQQEIILKPMSSYERRIVHLALSSDPDIVTESVGDGLERRVAIKPSLNKS